jgi:hypothetical protein
MTEIPPFRLVPEPLTPEAAASPGFQWAPDEVGTRHRLGGKPEAVQPVEYPSCSECKNVMTFYGQLDSLSDAYCIGDVGLVYVFLCFDCLTAEAVVDSA